MQTTNFSPNPQNKLWSRHCYCGCRWEIRSLWSSGNCFNDTTNIKNLYESGFILFQKQDLNHHNTTIMLFLFSCQVMSDSATPWTAAYQASLSLTISQSLLKFMSIESVIPSNHLILCHHLLPPILHWMKKWQTTPVFLSWEHYDLYKKAIMLYLQLIYLLDTHIVYRRIIFTLINSNYKYKYNIGNDRFSANFALGLWV